MDKILDITVIIPVHKLDDDSSILLKKAIESVKNQQVKVKAITIVAPEEVALQMTDEEYKDINIVYNDGETDFCSQVNFGVSQVETEYFSILELDDEYSKGYFKNVDAYISANPNVSGFLPILVMVDAENQALQYVNEAVWAHGFSEQMGQMDMASLLQYDNFMISGGVFKKEAYEEVGGLKPNIKLYFNYEFLLRFVNNDFTTMIIPKLGYKHLVDRADSLFTQYKDKVTGIKHDEAKFYLGAAKKEYFFHPDIPRTIKYSPAETE